MKFFRSTTTVSAGFLVGLGLLMAFPIQAQPPGGGGPGGGGFRRGFGFGEPSLSRELMNQEFAAKMKMTDEQMEQLREIDMQRREYFRSAFRGGPGGGGGGQPSEEFQAKMKEFEASVTNVLTAEQKTVWETRKAEVKAQNAANEGQRPDGRSDGGGRDRGDRGDRGPRTEPAQPDAAPTRKMNFNDEKAPEGVAPTATFGGPTAGDGTTGTPVGEGKLSFNFRYAPWSDVLKLFAEAAGLTLDLNEVPPGTFNYYDDKTYTFSEALDVLNGYLLPKGYALIRRDRFLVAINLDNGIPPGLVPTVSLDELSQRGANELIIVDVPLEGMEADKIVADVRELANPWAKIFPTKGTNTLNILDTGSSIRRIVRLLKMGNAQDSRETAFRSIALKYISAADAERTVRRLFGLTALVTSTPMQPGFGFGQFGGGFGQFGGGGFGGFRGGDRGNDRGGDNRDQQQQQQQRQFPMATTPSTPSPFQGKIQVTADTRTNHLLITSTPALVKVVEDAVKAIDVPQDNQLVKTDSPVSLKAYVVPGGDPTQVSQTINAILPGLVAGVDTRSGKIYIQGTQEEHAEVDKLMKTMAGDSNGSVDVIPLMRLDPVQATNTLRNLFSTETRPPTIEADVQGRRILFRGSADQMAQVKIVLQRMGEIAGPQEEKVDKGPVRKVQLGPHDPEDFLPFVRQMWDAAERTPIRVVVPSQGSPIRDRRVPADHRPDYDAGQAPQDEIRTPARPTRTSLPEREKAGPSTNVTRPASILQVSQSGESRSTNEQKSVQVRESQVKEEAVPANPPSAIATPSSETPAKEAPTKEPAEKLPTEKSTGESTRPLTVSVIGGEMIITGGTNEERDQLEEIINNLTAALPVRTKWTVFYLRSADATDTAQMLERLFPQSNVTATTSSAPGMFGSLTSGLSQLGRGMMSSTGLNQTLGGANNLRIITDTRANALFVAGPQDQIREVEQMLELLDASELPDSLRSSVPRTIPVEYADVEEVAQIVEDVFKDAMTPPQAAQQQQQNGQRFNPLAMLMGGGAGGGGRKEQGTPLTVGVDRRTSHLIVACNDSLFRQIEGLVTSIDERARDAKQTVRIVALKTADPAIVQSSLTSLMPKVTVSTSRSGTTRRRRDGTDGQPAAPAAAGGNDADLLRRTMQQQQQQQTFPNPGQFRQGNQARPQNMGRPQGGAGGNRGGNGGRGAGGRAGN